MVNLYSKMTSVVGGVAIVASTMSASLVAASSEFLPYAEVLVENDVISTQATEAGYRLGDNITRAELAKVVANLGQYDATACAGDVYSDVGASLGNLCGYVEALAEGGVISTTVSTFRPLAQVTRAEMVKMILGALGEEGSAESAGYMDTTGLGDLATYINRANELGCAKDGTYFRPNATSSRGEAFKIAACAAGLTVDSTTTSTGTTSTGTTSTGTTSTGTTSTGTTVASGALTVSLSGTAMAQYVPKNASSVKVGTVTLKAGAAATTVQSLVVSRSGLGNATDITSSNGIRAAQNGVIVSSSADYYNSTSQKGNVYFSPALTIPANGSVTVDLLVNLSGAENSQHQFTLDAVNASNTTVTGAPLTLGLLNTTSYVTAKTTVILSKSTSVLTPGKTNQSIVKVEMTSGNRDTKTQGFTLTRAGVDFTKRLANVKVYRGGVEVGTVSLSNEKLSVLGLSDTLTSGNTQTYEIKADVLVDGSNSGALLGFKFDATSDVSATEVATGYSTTVSTTPVVGTAETISFADVEVVFAKTSTGNLTVAPGTNNLKLFNGKLTSSVPLTVRGMKVMVNGAMTGVTDNAVATASGIQAFVNNQLAVKVNGAEVATLTDLVTTTLLPSFVVDSASPAVITIEGSLKSSDKVTGNVTFTVELTDVRDSSNNTATIGAGKSLTGDKTTVNTAAVEIKTATIAAPSTSRLFASADQEIGRFAVYAQNEAVRLQNITLVNTGSASLSGAVSSSTSVKIYDVATGNEVSSSATITNNNLVISNMNDTIAKDTTKNYKVVASIGSIDNTSGTIQLSYSTGTVVRDTNSNVLTPTSTSVSFKAYTLGVVPPTVAVATTTTLDKYLVTVTNVDTNTGITLTGVTLKFQSRFAGSTSTSFSGTICLRDQGSSSDCGAAGTTVGQAVTGNGGTFTFAISSTTLTSAGNSLAKNGGNTTFEVYVQNAPLFIAGDYTQTAVEKVFYNGSSESYVGVTGASATATK